MSEEMQAVTKILEVGTQWIRMGGGASMKFIQFLMAQQHAHIVTAAGPVSYETLMKHGSGETVLVNIHTENQETLKSLGKSMSEAKILYTPLQDLNIGDGNTQFLIDAKDVQKFNVLMKGKTDIGRDSDMSMDDYVNTGDPEKIQETMEKAKENVKDNPEGTVPQSTRDMESRSEDVLKTYRNDDNLLEISIDKESLVDRSSAEISNLGLSEDQFACRIPGTKNGNEKYLVIPDTHVFEVAGEKKDRFVAFIPKDDMPDILEIESNRDLLENDVVNYVPDEKFAQSGQELYEKSFDPHNSKRGNEEMANGERKFRLLSDKRANQPDKIINFKEAVALKEMRRRDDVFERTRNLEGTREIRIDKSDLFSSTKDSTLFFLPGRPDSYYVIPTDYIKDAGNGKHFRAVIPQNKSFEVINIKDMAAASKMKAGEQLPADLLSQRMTMRGGKLAKLIKDEQAKANLLASKADSIANKTMEKDVASFVQTILNEAQKAGAKMADQPDKGGR